MIKAMASVSPEQTLSAGRLANSASSDRQKAEVCCAYESAQIEGSKRPFKGGMGRPHAAPTTNGGYTQEAEFAKSREASAMSDISARFLEKFTFDRRGSLGRKALALYSDRHFPGLQRVVSPRHRLQSIGQMRFRSLPNRSFCL
jgi:hypothetical protein